MNQHIISSVQKSSSPPPLDSISSRNEQPNTSISSAPFRRDEKEKSAMSFRIDDILVKSRGNYDSEPSEDIIKSQQEAFLNRKSGSEMAGAKQANHLMASISSLYKYFTPMMMNKGISPDIMSLIYNGRCFSNFLCFEILKNKSIYNLKLRKMNK